MVLFFLHFLGGPSWVWWPRWRIGSDRTVPSDSRFRSSRILAARCMRPGGWDMDHSSAWKRWKSSFPRFQPAERPKAAEISEGVVSSCFIFAVPGCQLFPYVFLLVNVVNTVWCNGLGPPLGVPWQVHDGPWVAARNGPAVSCHTCFSSVSAIGFDYLWSIEMWLISLLWTCWLCYLPSMFVRNRQETVYT